MFTKREAENPVARRLELVLAGRSPWQWAKRVLLSNGSITRLWQGSIPDLGRMTPAIRIERLSITWLHDGSGPPFPVACPGSDSACVDLFRTLCAEQPNAQVCVCRSADRVTVLMHWPVHAVHLTTSKAGTKETAYDYRATIVIGGGSVGNATLRAVRTIEETGTPVALLDMPHADWLRLASGYLGNYELFGDKNTHGLLAQARTLADATYPRVTRAVHDRPDPITEAMSILQDLPEADQQTSVRLLRGLRDNHY